MPILVSPASGSGQPVVNSGAYLVSQVARIAGGESEPAIRAHALDCLNRIRTRLNKRQWRWTKTTQSGITLVLNTQTYTLASGFSRPSFARLVDTNSKPYAALEYQDDAVFMRWNEPQQQTGEPRFYMLRNSFSDGLISLYPIPNASAATNFTMTVEYYARVPTITDDPSTISVLPEEVIDVFVLGGRAELMSERQKDKPETAREMAKFDEAEQLLIAWDRRITDDRSRFRMGPRRVPLGSIYIRVD